MKYIVRTLRVLAYALIFPLIIVTFFVGALMLPSIYLSISAFYYIKNGNDSEYDKVTHYMNVIDTFLTSDIWEYPTKYILKTK